MYSQNIAFVVSLLGFNQSIFHILVEFIPWSDVAVVDVSALKRLPIRTQPRCAAGPDIAQIEGEKKPGYPIDSRAFCSSEQPRQIKP